MKSLACQSKNLKGRTIGVTTGRNAEGAELVVLSLGKRLTPESVGGNHRVVPVALARLSENRRMHFTEVALSPEGAVVLHKLLDETLREAGLIQDTLEESLAKRISQFISKMVLSYVIVIFHEHKRTMRRVKTIEAPA